MSDKLNIFKKFSPDKSPKTKGLHYNPNNIDFNKKQDYSLDIDIENEDNIFTFICSEKNNKENNSFLGLIYQLETRVNNNIEKQNIEKLSTKYSNFNFDIEWVDRDYKNLIVKQISEDLITQNILDILKKS